MMILVLKFLLIVVGVSFALAFKMIQALRDVFDSNHDGKAACLHAATSPQSIARQSARGRTAHTLTELGITSINLKADLTHMAYADGSAITGEATFTKSDGSTGTVANTTLAADDASGTVSLSHTGYGADGSIAFLETSVTSADGHNSSTSYDDNGDGILDHIQVITTTVDGAGIRTELLSDYNGGGIKMEAANDNRSEWECAA